MTNLVAPLDKLHSPSSQQGRMPPMKLAQLEKREAKEKTALSYLMDAWDEALLNGVKQDSLATAALFTALSSLVDHHGEEAVATLTERLVARIKKGEFTLARSSH